MDASNWAAIITSLFALFGVWAASRNARRAAEKNAVVVSTTEIEKTRATAETEAYIRARKMDIETIDRQDAEIAEVRTQNFQLNNDVKMLHADNIQLHADNEHLRIDNERLREEVRRLNTRMARLEYGLPITQPMREINGGK